MQKKYKKILFDLDNTLVNDDENRKCAIKKLLKERNELITDEKVKSFIEIDNKWWKDRAEGKIKVPQNIKNEQKIIEWDRAQRFIKFFNGINYEEGVELNKKYFNYLSENIVPISNAYNILEYLYKKQYDLYIVTNGPINLINNKLSVINTKKFIKEVFSAEEAGDMKPSSEFFEKFFSKIQYYEKNSMLIVGDELEKDVLGGIQNGIDSCWFNRNRQKNGTKYKPSYEINNLMELKKIL